MFMVPDGVLLWVLTESEDANAFETKLQLLKQLRETLRSASFTGPFKKGRVFSLKSFFSYGNTEKEQTFNTCFMRMTWNYYMQSKNGNGIMRRILSPNVQYKKTHY